jgi:hypothetical protein
MLSALTLDQIALSRLSEVVVPDNLLEEPGGELAACRLAVI